MIPTWAPNVHPMVVHFPIGLLIMAAAGIVGIVLLQQAAERGARLVYEHGVGVIAALGTR